MFITFEGTEGCGKSTLIQNLSRELTRLKTPHVTTREPGGTRIAESIRKLILNQEMDPLTELFLYEASRAEHLKTTVRPALQTKKWVLCDRYTDSTLAYQGFARKLDLKMIEQLNRIATLNTQPDLTFFLDLPVEIGLARATEGNKFEDAGVKFQKDVRRGFLYSIRKDPKRFRILKVLNQTPEQVCAKALKALEPFL